MADKIVLKDYRDFTTGVAIDHGIPIKLHDNGDGTWSEATPGSGGGGGGGGAVTVADGADVALGATTDAAPISDSTAGTAIGFLKRISARLTATISAVNAVIAALGSPFQVGGGLGASSALIGKVGLDQTTPGTTNKVSIGTDGTVAINAALPAGAAIVGKVGIDSANNIVSVSGTVVTKTDASGSITVGGTAQTIIASNVNRKGFEIQNQSTGDLYFSTLAVAIQGQPSMWIPPGALYETPLGGSGTGAVSVIGATTGQAFSAREWT